MPQLTTTRFGTIKYKDEDVLTLIDGLIGFPRCTRFLLLSHKPRSVFRWLQSVDQAELAFLVTDPNTYFEGYKPAIADGTAEGLGIKAGSTTCLLTTVSIPHGRPEEMSINLAGPILINADTRLGRQFVVENEAYTMKHRVFRTADSPEERAAA